MCCYRSSSGMGLALNQEFNETFKTLISYNSMWLIIFSHVLCYASIIYKYLHFDIMLLTGSFHLLTIGKLYFAKIQISHFSCS